MSIKYSSVKRCLDIAVAAPALVVAAPVMLATGAAVRVSMGSPVIFRQQRPGMNAQPITLLKFRSMRAEDPDRDPLGDQSYRVTRVGKFIRDSSLDELPSLFNVLRGDLSLVGPRPLQPEYLERYTPHQARRHEVKPGLTGLAQVSGRNSLSWEERFDLDVEYVDNHNFLMDLNILIRTVGVVLGREGITAEAGATMPTFWGTQAPEQGQSSTSS